MTTSALQAPPVERRRDCGEAIETLARYIDSQRGGDQRYFRNQLARYTRTMQRIQELHPAPCRVLDIGSHYLHQGVLLSELGHEVHGIDISLFADAPFIMDRAQAFGIRNTAVNALERGDFLPGQDGRFDLIVFTEILEHITFNPVRFWQRVHDLLAPGGTVYLSTPNSLRPAAWLRALLNLFTLRGIGLSVDEIMGNVTYGHHWKEYSTWEIRRYFSLLSSDFSVTTSWYSSDLGHSQGLKTQVKRALALIPSFRSDIEAVVRRSGHSGFIARPPELQMTLPLSERAEHDSEQQGEPR